MASLELKIDGCNLCPITVIWHNLYKIAQNLRVQLAFLKNRRVQMHPSHPSKEATEWKDTWSIQYHKPINVHNFSLYARPERPRIKVDEEGRARLERREVFQLKMFELFSVQLYVRTYLCAPTL